MAQSGYTPILIYASGTTGNQPLAANLTSSASGAELALNYFDGKLFYKDASGNVQVLATNASATGSFTSITDSGNLTFTGTGNRITGDFSNATVANRVSFQTSTVNGATSVVAIPNGTAGNASFGSFNNSDPTNAAYGAVGVVGSTDVRLTSGITGTGTYLPMTFYTNGVEQLRLTTGGALQFSQTGMRITGDFTNATQANKVMFQSSTTNGNTNVGFLPNGTAVQTVLQLHNNADPTNAGICQLITNTTDISLRSGITGTGTYLPMTFYTSGSEKLRIAADTTGTYTFGGTAPRITGDFSNATYGNNVSFQTSTANSLTMVGAIPNGTATAALFRTFNNSNTSNAHRATFGITSTFAYFDSGASGAGTYLPMTFYTGGSERMRIDTSGNVGIGLTTVPDAFALYNASAARLTVYGDGQTQINAYRYSTDAAGPAVGLRKYRGSYASPTAVASGDTIATINFGAYGGTNNRNVVSIGGYVDTYTSDTNISSYITFGTSPSGSAASTERMRIDSSGNVGIGTSSPQARLHIRPATNVNLYGSAGGSAYQWTAINDAQSAYIDLITNGLTQQFQTGGTERMRIDASGSVSIGTTSAGGYKFAINSGGKTQYFTTDATSSYYYTDGNFYFGATGTYNVVAVTNNIERMRIDANGNVGIGTSNPITALTLGNTKYLSWPNAAGLLSATAGSSIFKYSDNHLYIDNADATAICFRRANYVESMRIDSSGNVLVTSPAGLGYGTGSGGTVTQATNKATAVTLNKPTGQITMNNAALAGNTSVTFRVNNNLVAGSDTVIVSIANSVSSNNAYQATVSTVTSGAFDISLRNITAGSLSDAVVINFAIIKGATS